MVAWLQSTADADLHLSAGTLGEIQAGIELTRDQDPSKAAQIEAWLELVAIVHNLTVVARNVADFTDFKVRVFNPFVQR